MPAVPQLPPPSQDHSSTSSIKLEDLVLQQTAKPAIPQLPTVDPAGIATLLSNLVKAGVVSANSTPSNADAPVKEQELPVQESIPVRDKEMAIREYRESLMSEDINLDTFDLAKCVPYIFFFGIQSDSLHLEHEHGLSSISMTALHRNANNVVSVSLILPLEKRH